MASIATGIILTAGTMTFVNEWYQLKKVNWRVPVATLLGAAIFDGLAHIDEKAAVGLAIIVLMGAATTKFGGKSAVDTIASFFKESTAQRKTQPRLKVA